MAEDMAVAAGIRAAGAVLYRHAAAGTEVALIHRLRYRDWTFPKGKVEPGEHLLTTAVREVAEETGIRVILGRRLSPTHYGRDGRVKRVDYWAARAATPTGAQAPFKPNSEVDDLAWVPAAEAGARLSYAHDADVLAGFTAGPADTVPCILLRHAASVRKDAWHHDDLDRPLDSTGETQAAILAGLLSCFGPMRVVSSAAERCVATVRPFATRTDVQIDIEIEPALTVRRAGIDSAAVAQWAAKIAADGQPVVICAHRENLPLLLAAARSRLSAPPLDGPPLDFGGFWVLHAAAGTLAAAERYHPDDA